jgi:hypothetical protein
MKRSNYWYAQLLTRHAVRPLYVGLVAGVALLLIFVIWAALVDWLGGDVHFSVSNLAFEGLAIAFVSCFIGATVSTLEMTPRDVLALAPALELDETAS